MNPRILCIGHAAYDSIYRVAEIPRRPTKVFALDYAESGGGMASNASVAAARLGASVELWSRVGDDAIGERILAALAAEGIDTSAVRRFPGCHSTSTAILVDARGNRLICVHDDPRIDADATWLPLDRIARADAMLVDVRWPEGAHRALDVALDVGTVSVLDGDVGDPDVLLALAGKATHSVFSEHGLEALTGASTPGQGLAEIAPECHGLAGVTLGAEGFLWLEDGCERRVHAPKATAVDTLAAGDVWHGAFAVGLAEGRDIEQAARFANVAAAIKCTRFGGRSGAPTRAEVDEALRLSD